MWQLSAVDTDKVQPDSALRGSVVWRYHPEDLDMEAILMARLLQGSQNAIQVRTCVFRLQVHILEQKPRNSDVVQGAQDCTKRLCGSGVLSNSDPVT